MFGFEAPASVAQLVQLVECLPGECGFITQLSHTKSLKNGTKIGTTVLLAFYLYEYILFGLTISYKPFVFSVSVFCSQICSLKSNLWLKISLTYAISIVN